MDFLNNLLTAAAGYYGQDQKNAAQLKLASVGLQTTTAPVTTAPATVAARIIPGVENSTLLMGGAGLLALGLVAFIARRR